MSSRIGRHANNIDLDDTSTDHHSETDHHHVNLHSTDDLDDEHSWSQPFIGSRQDCIRQCEG